MYFCSSEIFVITNNPDTRDFFHDPLCVCLDYENQLQANCFVGYVCILHFFETVLRVVQAYHLPVESPASIFSHYQCRNQDNL